MIESVKMEGKGKFEITGMLGDVMKESVRAAMGWIKAYWPTVKMLSKNNLHINFDTIDIHVIIYNNLLDTFSCRCYTKRWTISWCCNNNSNSFIINWIES